MISQKTRRQVYRKYEGKCVYCGNPVPFEEATIDHRMPKFKGGGDYKYNYFLSCRTCNQYKADEVIEPLAVDYIKNRMNQLLDKFTYLKKRT